MLKYNKVKLKWYKNNKKYYISKGYLFTNFGEEFEIHIGDLPKGSCVLIEYICDYCQGENQKGEISKFKEYKVLLRCRKSSNKDCCGHKECKYKKLSEELSLKSIKENGSFAEKYPKLSLEWNYDKNKGTPDEYSYGSPNVVWWICEYRHEWEASILDRTNKGNGCPYCSGNKVHLDNCLAKSYPEISEEWHPTKNGTLTPYDVTKSSNKIVWWKCKNNHEWKISVNRRTDSNSRCADCETEMKIDKILVNTNPDIALEWHPRKNGELTPNNFTYGSPKKVWWICKTCSYEWQAEIKSRTLLNSGCPLCNESKGEKKIREYLIMNCIEYEHQKEFEGLVGINGGLLSYDYYLPKLNLLLEYQGEFHDGNGNYYMKQNLEKQQEHDQRKREYSKINNIKLLEIWYWDFNNIDDILTKELSKYNLL